VQASNSTCRLDEHLEGIKGGSKARPTAAELLESLAELAQGTQAARAPLMLSLAARVVVKSDLTLEDLEARIPQGLQLSLLLHVRKVVQQLDSATRTEWQCHIHRWVLRTVVRGENPTQGCRQLPGGEPEQVDSDVWDPKAAAQQLGELLAQHSDLLSPPAVQRDSSTGEADLPLLCATSYDLAEWHLHRGELQRAEELFRTSLAIIHRLDLPVPAKCSQHTSNTGRRCMVRPERLSALALALRMLRLSHPDAPPTPQVTRDSKKHLGDDLASAARGNEIPISASAALVLTAEQLRLSGHNTQLIQLLHIDNLLRLARCMSQRDPSAGTSSRSEPGSPAEASAPPALVPLPWSYRENLCLWMLESSEVAVREGLSKRVAAANSVVTLASAPQVPAVVCLKMLQGALSSSASSHAAASGADAGVGAKRARLLADR
jgi:hypothetical protein